MPSYESLHLLLAGPEAGEDLTGEDVCDEAKRLTSGDRNVQYGDPNINFLETAQLWSTYLGHPISPDQVGMCQVLLKIARDKHSPKRDNIVDGIGYLRCVQRVRNHAN